MSGERKRQRRKKPPEREIYPDHCGVPGLKWQPPKKPPEQEAPLTPRVEIETINDPALAADLCRRILRAQARTAARKRKEQDDDAA